MILLTGATGAIGSELVKELGARKVPAKALVRRPEAAGKLREAGIEPIAGDLADPASLAAALKGVTKLFLLAPPVENLYKLEFSVIHEAQRAGVKHIVYLSAVGAAPGAPHRFGDWHGQAEQLLQRGPMQYTILRPNFFMQNLLGLAGMVKGGTIYVSAGTGKAPFVDVRDIAAVAAVCLSSAGHENKSYEVTGPAAISYGDIAAAFSRVLGKPVQYVDVTAEAAKQSMVGAGMPAWLAEGLVELNEGMKQNRFADVSDTVQRLTGRAPIMLERFLQEHRGAFVG